MKLGSGIGASQIFFLYWTRVGSSSNWALDSSIIAELQLLNIFEQC